MAIDQGSTATTKLLTLLNVSATKVGKRKRVYGSTNEPTKLNKRKKSVRLPGDMIETNDVTSEDREASPIATTLTNDSLDADEESYEDCEYMLNSRVDLPR